MLAISRPNELQLSHPHWMIHLEIKKGVGFGKRRNVSKRPRTTKRKEAQPNGRQEAQPDAQPEVHQEEP